jgi:hypothetical protein
MMKYKELHKDATKEGHQLLEIYLALKPKYFKLEHTVGGETRSNFLE